MGGISAVLSRVAEHGRFVLILGLVAGVLLPGLAVTLKPVAGEMIAFLLFLSALRIGPRAVLGGLRDIGTSFTLVLAYQFAIPCLLALLLLAAGFSGELALAMILMVAASPMSSSPNLTIMTGHEPAPALRLLIIGTALLPLTVIPALWLSPAADSLSLVFTVSLRLLMLIVVAVGAAFAIRHFLWKSPEPASYRALDGLAAIIMAVVVIGLMSAVGPALLNKPLVLAGVLALSAAMNFGLQAGAYAALRNAGTARVAYAIVAGNRNMGLFLAVLPPETIDRILLFLGCYQISMYLTPTLMRRLYR
ncbi:MAG: hypothetical protein KDJ62_09160 [Rhodobiaceae bacterium]|nr:hypothetical protein [Rhodobiaceae bacterium]MCC0047618.1 hypothetical protein [Rhodobiaceae bacterium]